MDFQNFMEIEFCWRLIVLILIIHKPSLGSCEDPQKNWVGSVQSFLRLLDTNKQTPQQAEYIERKRLTETEFYISH